MASAPSLLRPLQARSLSDEYVQLLEVAKTFGGSNWIAWKGETMPQGSISPIAPETKPRRQSDTRFRSFAERFVAARCHLFRQEQIAEDTWACIKDAERAYKMVRMVGFNAFEDEEGPRF